MEPSIEEGRYVLVNRWAYLLKRPSRGDVVVVKHPSEDRFLVKRIDLAGSDEYFVVGDNSEHSVDSREFGPVSRDLIVGRVLFQFAGR